MDNKPDVGAVDSHAEGNGGNNYINFFTDEFVLVYVPGTVREPGMVWNILKPERIQFL